MGRLALSANEFGHAEKCGSVVEIQMARDKHPGEKPFYRPTGFDSFMEDTRFCPNTGRDEEFGRTCPVEPAPEDAEGFQEAVTMAIRYDKEFGADERLRIRIFQY